MRPTRFSTNRSLIVASQNKEDASELLQQKAELERQTKEATEIAVAKEAERDRKIKTIGNYVHDSVPISDNEVGLSSPAT